MHIYVLFHSAGARPRMSARTRERIYVLVEVQYAASTVPCVQLFISTGTRARSDVISRRFHVPS